MGKKKVNVGGQQAVTDDEDSRLGRRGFIKSLFSLSAAVGERPQPARAAVKSASFFWCNLKNGQVAFPTGTSLPSGPPGSIMKIITAVALRQSGMFAGDETIECRGAVRVAGQTYKCLAAHGRVDLTRALGLSCNVFFATASQRLNPRALLEYGRRFGLNDTVAGYRSGVFPTAIKGDITPYALGLSPELQPNALQIMRVAALVANSGALPPLHNAAEDPSCDKPFNVQLPAATWIVLQQGMRIATREGTAKQLDAEDRLQISAKTGTVPHGKSFESWITGYFPVNAPRYAFCLRAPAGTSYDIAVPEAHRFLFSAPWP